MDLDVPHVFILVPHGRYYGVAESDVLVQVILFCYIFEVLQDFGGARIALETAMSVKF